MCAVELLCFGIAQVSLTKPSKKERCCLDSSNLFGKVLLRLTGTIPKQSNSTAQIRQPPWLNLRRKTELDLLPLELDFLYGTDTYHHAAVESLLPRPRDEVADAVLALAQRSVRHVRRQRRHDYPQLEQLRE